MTRKKCQHTASTEAEVLLKSKIKVATASAEYDSTQKPVRVFFDGVNTEVAAFFSQPRAVCAGRTFTREKKIG